ncbi:hypothetical protein HUJ05_009715 [Dendroctonus ponderosae]|nr:hypothetical protein HUJ05_009715 [Dendroctonus ponderosae]
MQIRLVTLAVIIMPSVPPAKPDLPLPKYVDSLWCIYVVSVVAAWNAEFLHMCVPSLRREEAGVGAAVTARRDREKSVHPDHKKLSLQK